MIFPGSGFPIMSKQPQNLTSLLSASPVIAAVRKPADLTEACASAASVLFILHAEIGTLADAVQTAKHAGKCVFVHFDLIDGLSQDPAALRFIKQTTETDGIISTRSSVIRSAKEEGFFTVQRFFVVDSQAEETVLRTVPSTHPDLAELMPGLILPVIRRITKEISVPVIAGGLIEDKTGILQLLSAGAAGISTGKKELWNV